MKSSAVSLVSDLPELVIRLPQFAQAAANCDAIEDAVPKSWLRMAMQINREVLRKAFWFPGQGQWTAAVTRFRTLSPWLWRLGPTMLVGGALAYVAFELWKFADPLSDEDANHLEKRSKEAEQRHTVFWTARMLGQGEDWVANWLGLLTQGYSYASSDHSDPGNKQELLPIPSSYLVYEGRQGIITPEKDKESERKLWEEYAASHGYARFEILNRLQALYFRNLRYGGKEGLSKIQHEREALSQYIISQNAYEEFLRFNPDGTTVLHIPNTVPRPAVLNLTRDTPLPPVIYTQDRSIAYFLISALTFIQGVVSDEEIEKYSRKIREKHPTKPVIISYDKRRARHILWDGYHRTFSAHCLGHQYILGDLLWHYPVPPSAKVVAIDEIKITPHAEILRIIEANQENKSLEYGAIFLFGEEE